MEWNIIDVQSLAIIDHEINEIFSEIPLSSAEYEIVRRVIYQTADFEYFSLMQFSKNALSSGAAALSARTTIIVDVSMVKVGIIPKLQQTFSNPVYCSHQATIRSQKLPIQPDWEMQTLAKRYPEAVFVIGESQASLIALLELVEEEEISPALIIGTPAGFIGANVVKQRLHDTSVPHIIVNGRKGTAVVAVAIVNGLLDLVWQADG